MLFTTTNDHEELRAAIRGFAETKVKPIAFSLDKESKFPTEIVKEMGENGWMGLPYPKEYGGAGMDYIAYAIAVEELARVDGGVGVILSAHVSLGSYPIFAFGTEEQKQKIPRSPLPKVRRSVPLALQNPMPVLTQAAQKQRLSLMARTGFSTATRFSLPTAAKLIRTLSLLSPIPTQVRAASVPLSSKKACPVLPSAIITTNWGSVPPLRLN